MTRYESDATKDQAQTIAVKPDGALFLTVAPFSVIAYSPSGAQQWTAQFGESTAIASDSALSPDGRTLLISGSERDI